MFDVLMYILVGILLVISTVKWETFSKRYKAGIIIVTCVFLLQEVIEILENLNLIGEEVKKVATVFYGFVAPISTIIVVILMFLQQKKKNDS